MQPQYKSNKQRRKQSQLQQQQQQQEEDNTIDDAWEEGDVEIREEEDRKER